MRVSDVHDIPAELRNEVEHFFQVYKDPRRRRWRRAASGTARTRKRFVAEARTRSLGTGGDADGSLAGAG